MSFYRGYKPPTSDLHHAPGGHAARGAGSGAHDHLRRARPVLILLPRTAYWIASLPERVRPGALAEKFPRIANHLAATWHDPAAFHAYLRDLTEDRRGGRQGFPEDVACNLHDLWAYYAHAVQGIVGDGAAAGRGSPQR